MEPSQKHSAFFFHWSIIFTQPASILIPINLYLAVMLRSKEYTYFKLGRHYTLVCCLCAAHQSNRYYWPKAEFGLFELVQTMQHFLRMRLACANAYLLVIFVLLYAKLNMYAQSKSSMDLSTFHSLYTIRIRACTWVAARRAVCNSELSISNTI